MKRLFRRATSLLLGFILAITAVTQAAAVSYKPIEFTPGGEHFVWSDNPEYIYASTFYLSKAVFTVQTNMDSNMPYTFEYYHYNTAKMPLTFAVQLTNNSSSSVRYRITKNAKGYSSTDYRTMSANVHKNFENSTTDVYRTLAPNASVLVPESMLTVGNNNTVNSRIRITPAGSGLNGRIVVCQSSSTSQPKVSPQATDDGKSRTAAYFPYGKLYGWLDLGTKGTKYKICSSEWSLNPSEYPASEYASNAGRNGNGVGRFKYTCHGNYGVYYAFSLKNSNGNSLKLYAEDGGTRLAFYKQGSNAWTTKVVPAGGITIPMSGTEFTFMLTGSNSGSIVLEVV